MRETDFKFSQPYIKESVFKLNGGFNSEDESQSVLMETKVNVYSNYKEDQEDKFALGGLTIQVGDESSEAPFYAKITIEANFSWEEETESEKIIEFMKVNAPALLVGYARPVITFLTSNSPYPPFYLSFINFAE